MQLHRYLLSQLAAQLLGGIVCIAIAIAIVPSQASAEELRSPAGEKLRDVFVVPDALGSPAALLDESGAILWRQGFGPYGEGLAGLREAEEIGTLNYTGHQADSNGLVYMGARYYDPEIGRFLSMDPAGFDIGNVQSFNRYAYANNNPYRFVDPDGEAPFFVPGLIAVGKELAGEAFEEVTGVPAPTVKNLGKAAIKHAAKEAGGSTARSSVKSAKPKRGLNATQVTAKGIARVEKHLTRTPGIEPGPAELKMIERLKSGARTDQDLRFYQHEIIESRMINKTRKLHANPVDAARDAHHRTLRKQGLYRRGYETELYHPDALRLAQ